MNTAIRLAEVFLAVTIFIQFATVLLVTVRSRFGGRRKARPPKLASVSVVRTVCGIDYATDRTLRSGFLLDYPDYELVFCVASPRDPVIKVIEGLMADHPKIPARILIGDDRISINPKLNNLVKGWKGAKYDWIVMTDSNVLMPSDYLTRMLDRFTGDTGLVCSPPLGSEPDGVWAEMECAYLNTFQARFQLASDAIGNGFAQGKSMLWRRENLDRHGGIEALAAEAAEDAASTKVIRSNGQRVRLVYRPFVQPIGPRSLRAVWWRQLRWARLRRVTFPIFFTFEFVVGGFFPILIAALLASYGTLPIWLVPVIAVSWYGAEAIMAKVLDWHVSWLSPAAWILRDVSLPMLWIAAVSGNGFEWRGNQMNVKEDSLLAVDVE